MKAITISLMLSLTLFSIAYIMGSILIAIHNTAIGPVALWVMGVTLIFYMWGKCNGNAEY